MLPERPRIEPLPAGQHGVKVTSFEKSCVDSHWHFHPEVELVWIEKGQGVLHAGRALFPYQAGQMVLAGANLPHAYGSHPGQRTGARWRVLHFRPSVWGETFWQLPENHRIQKLITSAGRGFVFTGEVVSVCADLLRRMETRRPGNMPLALVLELLERLALEKGRYCLNPEPVSGGEAPDGDPRLGRILAWLDERAGDAELTQAEVARWIKMSPQSFCRFFRRVAGRTFHHHLNELRVARACASLLGTEKPVGEIAFEAGFNNLSNFNRRFREITGRTPREYREAGGGVKE
ncbi:DNA-binding domain-containing protein, AraC-type [Opitutaceae bacterium TAV1]|nr:DNA-binding domain-containing protein, AraC-type [Opitutaceae bacterium TAV1]